MRYDPYRCRWARYSCQILTKKRNYLGRFSKNAEISNFMQIDPEGDELFHAARQTVMAKLTFAFIANFANASENSKAHLGCHRTIRPLSSDGASCSRLWKLAWCPQGRQCSGKVVYNLRII